MKIEKTALWTVFIITALIFYLPLTAFAQDTDGDGMPDAWENTHGCLMANTADDGNDPDGDGMTSLEEYTYSEQMDPCDDDTDNDGMDDEWEVENSCMNPLLDNNTISFEGSYETPEAASAVYVSGNYAYVAACFSGLHIIDVSNPAVPTLVGNFETGDLALDVQVSGSYAYVADDWYGLQIIDVSNPAFPTLTGKYEIHDSSDAIFVSGDYAYLETGMFGLHIINISNPANPALTGIYEPHFYRVYVSDSYAYLTTGSSGLQILDVSSPTAPLAVGNYDTSGRAFGIDVFGDYAYVADEYSGLQIIDVSNPFDPTLTGNFDTAGESFSVHITYGYAYIVEYNSNLHIIDVSTPASPILVKSFEMLNAARVFISGNYAYVTGTSGVQILRLLDTDGDSFFDIDEYNLGSNPCNPDSDSDGIFDGKEYNIINTDPLSWDTDNDMMPDGFEVTNSIGHTTGENLDVLDPADGMTADFDGDGNPNSHEYWNGTDPWTWDPVGYVGCGYWADSGEMELADGIVSSSDLAAMKRWLAGEVSTQYDGVIPPGGNTHDIDGDGAISSGDLGILGQMLSDTILSDVALPTRPNALVLIDSPSGNVSIGDTCHVTLGVGNVGGTRTPGIGVVFEIDPSSTRERSSSGQFPASFLCRS